MAPPLVITCLECGHEMKRLPKNDRCPKCGGTDVDIP